MLTSPISEDIPRAEVVAATLDHIQILLEEAEANNALGESLWANLNTEEPASLIARGFRSLIRFPFFVLKTSVIGIWNFNVLLFKIPLIPFYVLQKTFYGIATFFAPPIEEAESSEELNVEITQNDNSFDEGGQRQAAGSEAASETGFEDLYEFDRCSTELNGISEYNESIAGCLDHEPPESEKDEEVKKEGFVQLSEARPFQNSSFPRRYFSTYAPDLNISDMSDVESFRAFYEPPSRILESPERHDIDEAAPLPLYNLHERQGRNDYDL
uniref:Uncharacterized protein n=1 Tax=Panagrolaimus superbus TaxID=310955 RepID=A0A914Y1X5_9BILA